MEVYIFFTIYSISGPNFEIQRLTTESGGKRPARKARKNRQFNRATEKSGKTTLLNKYKKKLDEYKKCIKILENKIQKIETEIAEV